MRRKQTFRTVGLPSTPSSRGGHSHDLIQKPEVQVRCFRADGSARDGSRCRQGW